MKKIFLSLGFCFCVIGIAFGAWKFQVHKKLPWFHSRTPASVEEVTVDADKTEDPVEQAEQAEHSPKAEPEPQEAPKPQAKEEFKIKLQKLEKVQKHEKIAVAKSKPPEHHVVPAGTVTHTITKDETAWFLSSVYYGKGKEFDKILAANGFKNPADLKEGLEIQIPSPKFHKGQSGFAAHYSQLWDKRAKALKERNKDVEADKYLTQAPIPSSKVVIPTAKIRAKDKTPQFPFTEVKGDRQSHEQHGE